MKNIFNYASLLLLSVISLSVADTAEIKTESPNNNVTSHPTCPFWDPTRPYDSLKSLGAITANRTVVANRWYHLKEVEVLGKFMTSTTVDSEKFLRFYLASLDPLNDFLKDIYLKDMRAACFAFDQMECFELLSGVLEKRIGSEAWNKYKEHDAPYLCYFIFFLPHARINQKQIELLNSLKDNFFFSDLNLCDALGHLNPSVLTYLSSKLPVDILFTDMHYHRILSGYKYWYPAISRSYEDVARCLTLMKRFKNFDTDRFIEIAGMSAHLNHFRSVAHRQFPISSYSQYPKITAHETFKFRFYSVRPNTRLMIPGTSALRRPLSLFPISSHRLLKRLF